MERNEFCPICGKFKFTQKYLNKNNIRQDEVFDCPICGGEVVYSLLCKMNGDSFGKEYIAIYTDAELM